MKGTKKTAKGGTTQITFSIKNDKQMKIKENKLDEVFQLSCSSRTARLYYLTTVLQPTMKVNEMGANF